MWDCPNWEGRKGAKVDKGVGADWLDEPDDEEYVNMVLAEKKSDVLQKEEKAKTKLASPSETMEERKYKREAIMAAKRKREAGREAARDIGEGKVQKLTYYFARKNG